MKNYICSSCGKSAAFDVRIVTARLRCSCNAELLSNGQGGLVYSPLLAHPVIATLKHVSPEVDANLMYSHPDNTGSLWQGSLPPIGTVLQEAGYDTLVLAASEFQSDISYQDIEVICAPGDDDHRPHRMANFLPVWVSAAKIVVERVHSGKRVLVTCMAGLNRSGMVTALALKELTGWSGEVVVEHIRKNREHAMCNQTFAQYIMNIG